MLEPSGSMTLTSEPPSGGGGDCPTLPARSLSTTFLARSLSTPRSDPLRVHPLNPYRGKRALYRSAAEVDVTLEAVDAAGVELVGLWRRKIPGTGVILAIHHRVGRPPVMYWRASSSTFGHRRELAFDGPELGSIRRHLSDQGLSILVGFEWRRIALNARHQALRSEQSLWSSWAGAQAELEAALPTSARPGIGPGSAPPDRIRSRLAPLGDPRSSPFRGKRAFFRELSQAHDDLARADRHCLQLVRNWDALGLHADLSLALESDRPLRWRVRAGGPTRARRLDFFSPAIDTIRRSLDPSSQCALLAAEFIRLSTVTRRKIARAYIDTFESAAERARALETFAPEGLRTPLTRDSKELLRFPRARPLPKDG